MTTIQDKYVMKLRAYFNQFFISLIKIQQITYNTDYIN
jgi:hypothetical protein